MSPARIAFLVVALAAGALAGGLKAGWVPVPERLNPWAELAPLAEPNLLTPMKLRRAQDDLPRCQAALETLGARFQPVPDQITDTGCGWTDALRLSAMGEARLGSPVVLSCRSALSLAMWEHHALQPAAQQHLRSRIASVQHLGSYACRNVNTGEPASPGARRSRHATADAIDIAGFTTADNQRVVIERDWRAKTPAGSTPAPGAQGAQAATPPEMGDDTSRPQFLRDVHAGACRFFDGVLGPAYNAVHANHFHLESGGWRTCR